ncbi:MAG: PorT family protein [Bacteroidales bacterium]|nr:PorT family protein [Bacteroidales bacterium]
MDSKLRSMLRDAEMKPSGRVWKGIEARLGAPSGQGRRGAWIWGISLAGAAAALAAVLVVSNTGNSNRLYISEDAVALTREPEATALPLSSLVPNELPSVEEVSGRVSAPASEVPARISEVSAPLGDGQEQVSVTDDGYGASTSADSEGAREISSTGVAGTDTGRSGESSAMRRNRHGRDRLDSTDGLDPEEAVSTRKGPLRLTAKGSVGQNIGTGYVPSRPMRAPSTYNPTQTATGIFETGSSTYGAPVTFGIGLNIPISGRISIGTGIDYSLLTRSFSGIYSEMENMSIEGNVMHKMHYVGIPLDVNFSVYRNRYINVYAFVGGEIEYCFSNTYTIRGGASDIVYREPVKGFQFSTEAGAGVEARLNNYMGLFLAPAVHYYFMGNQPKSIRTEKQFMVGVSAGLRFDLKEKR